MAARVSERQARKAARAALAASTLEWYDFYIYGTAAALVFNAQFFPTVDPLLGTLAAFATFGVAFVFRPVGALLFGHYGDRVGRKPTLVAATVLIGVATAAIGLLPTYESIGMWAAVLLVILRALQGVAAGGHIGGAILVATEGAPPGRKGLYGSFPQIGPSLAAILSSGVFVVLLAVLDRETFAAWGWRIPFLLSVVVVACGLWIQLRLEETPEFAELARRRSERQAESGGAAERRAPVLRVFRSHPRQIVQSAGMIFGIQVYYYITIVFSISYLERLGLARTSTVFFVMVSAAVTVITTAVSGHLSDRLGRRPVLLAAAVLMFLSVFPFFWAAETANPPLVFAGFVVAGAGFGAFYGPLAAFLTEMFRTDVRYSGATIGYQLGAVLGGGFAPLAGAALLAWTGSITAVALYVLAAIVVSLVSVALTSDDYHRGLRPASGRVGTESEVPST